MPDFKDNFRELRRERDMSQAQFAVFLGLSRQTVGFYEKGERSPDAKTIGIISKKCGVSADWLLGFPCDRRETLTEDLLIITFDNKTPGNMPVLGVARKNGRCFEPIRCITGQPAKQLYDEIIAAKP